MMVNLNLQKTTIPLWPDLIDTGCLQQTNSDRHLLVAICIMTNVINSCLDVNVEKIGVRT